MFKKILIANRGEIACRIARSCHRLGIPCAGVHSDADHNALHVQVIGESVAIGGVSAAESYLMIDKIIDAARTVGADAIHPGFGFLSENPLLAQAAADAGLEFIGPSAQVLTRFGDKATAKQIAIDLDIPVIPGSHQGSDRADDIRPVALSIGFPVLLKAVAGGGGKGIRIIHKQEELSPGIDAAMREGLSAFGDASLLVERYLPSGRHIEVQILGDGQGNVIHLYERECSLQRRQQKIIEEAPAANLDSGMRESLLDAAVRLGKHVKYRGLGTVEFLVTEKDFYFLEVNPRLQVEHPVTEQITGLDLIELQLRAVAGQGIALAQDQIKCSGHAIEARLYAEDPDNDFMPCTGQITHAVFPEQAARIEAGVTTGSWITPYYDPMIAKLITHGESRAQALSRMRQALQETTIDGVTWNQAFLRRLLSHPTVAHGCPDTSFVDQWLNEQPAEHAERHLAYAAAAIWYWMERHTTLQDTAYAWPQLSNWRLAANQETILKIPQYQVRLGSLTADAHIAPVSGHDGNYAVSMDDVEHNVEIVTLPDPSRLLINIDNISRTYHVHKTSKGLQLSAQGLTTSVAITSRLSTKDGHQASGHQTIEAPMMGKIIQVVATQGQSAQAGDVLIIMESMKMELRIEAPYDGIVETISCDEDTIVERGAILIEMNASQDETPEPDTTEAA